MTVPNRLCVIVALLACALQVIGCDASSSPKAKAKSPVMNTTYSTDIEGLRLLCDIPSTVESASWETFSIGNDWGLVAVLKCDGAVGIDITSLAKIGPQVRVGFDPLPKWVSDQCGVSFTRTAAGMYTVNTQAYDPSQFAKSPLLHGFVLNPSDDSLVIGLQTN